MTVKEALAELEQADSDEDISHTKLAEKHNCWRSTLTRRQQGVHASREEEGLNRRAMHPRDEAELVNYIQSLTKRHLMPTRQMIKNFAAPILGYEPGDSWVTRFLHRHEDVLITAWTTPMESGRHKADSGDKYRLYFELAHSKIAEYELEAEHTYNMDEKGFAIGVIGKSKRIFDKKLYGQKQYRQSLHDGNREWVTLLATICADGSTLPPGIIFAAAGRAVQASWVSSIDPKKHSVHFTTSPNGWTNNDLGLTWLDQLFERYTKPKARRKWRLLIIDGHGSHVTKDFIDYCDSHKILLLIFPPHATHTLQPLDVVCFKPLSTNYATALDNRTQKTHGWVPVKKSDFLPLFWGAWQQTFSVELVQKAFSATGLFPQDASKILNRFKPATPELPVTPPLQTAVSAASTSPDWLKAKALLRSIARPDAGPELAAAEQLIHQLHVLLELRNWELAGAKEALQERKKQKDKGKVLPLMYRDLNRHGGAKWWSPSSKQEADAREQAYEAYAAEQEAEKATERELKKTEKLLKKKRDEQARVRRAREKKERDERRAEERKAIDERKAERARKKQERDAQKAIQTPAKGKRKASTAAAPPAKRSRGAGGALRAPTVHEPPSVPAPTVNRRGRKILQPRKFW